MKICATCNAAFAERQVVKNVARITRTGHAHLSPYLRDSQSCPQELCSFFGQHRSAGQSGTVYVPTHNVPTGLVRYVWDIYCTRWTRLTDNL